MSGVFLVGRGSVAVFLQCCGLFTWVIQRMTAHSAAHEHYVFAIFIFNVAVLLCVCVMLWAFGLS